MPVKTVVLVCALLCAPGALANAPVEVLALFKDRAVVRASGAQAMLQVGETSADGITLLDADARSARVRYGGQVYDLTLSRHVAGSFRKADRQRIAIAPDALGQYRIRGTINGNGVNFLVDTGASVVAMSRSHADAIGLDVAGGDRGRVQTAQGTVGSHFVSLNTVEVGGLTAYNVRAAVIDGTYPTEILLGMSFLRQVGMEEQDGVLTLIQKQ